MVDDLDRARLEVSRLTPEQATNELADISVWLYLGAAVESNYHFNKSLVRVAINDRETKLHVLDYDLAKQVADRIQDYFRLNGNMSQQLVASSPPHVLEARHFASRWIKEHYDKLYSGKASLVMLPADNQGCGLWRMRLPASCWSNDPDLPFVVSLSDLALTYEEMLQYDIVVVQRLTDYNQWKVLKTLKEAGKKIVYEIDDDLFSVEPSNPAHAVCGRDDVRHSVRSCLDLADLVIVTTKELADALSVTHKAVVYPNSVDPCMFSVLRDPPARAPRLFWAGSNTHDDDFRTVLLPLISLMRKHSKLELVVLGGLPKTLQQVLDEEDEQLCCRISTQAFMRPELYLKALSGGVNADIGLIPLKDTIFNRSKSSVKALEYTIAGLPVVAANVVPYNLVYTHEKDALLCSNKKQWTDAIESLLESPEKRRRLVTAARELACEHFNIKNNAATLAAALSKLIA
jgi:glycosyltransferase involved in cell wall biosynthesis